MLQVLRYSAPTRPIYYLLVTDYRKHEKSRTFQQESSRFFLPKYWRRINRLWGDDFELRCESTAHPIYEHLHIGTLVVWKMIECLIEQKVTQFNLLWGRQVWKTQFLGVEYPWTIHTISKPVWLGVFWKNKLVFDQFHLRVWRYAKTKMGFNSSVDLRGRK